jgi:fatty acid/phospholipid biosynthesis enzyme
MTASEFHGKRRGARRFSGQLMIVTDGFTGNVMLKLSKADGRHVIDDQAELTASAVTKRGNARETRLSKH